MSVRYRQVIYILFSIDGLIKGSGDGRDGTGRGRYGTILRANLLSTLLLAGRYSVRRERRSKDGNAARMRLIVGYCGTVISESKDEHDTLSLIIHYCRGFTVVMTGT